MRRIRAEVLHTTADDEILSAARSRLRLLRGVVSISVRRFHALRWILPVKRRFDIRQLERNDSSTIRTRDALTKQSNKQRFVT